MLTSCSKNDLSPTDKLFEEASQYLEQFNYEAAESTFDKLAEMEKGVPWIAYSKAIEFETRLQYYDALHMYMLMANSYPGFSHALAGEWRMLSKIGEYQDALKSAIAYNELNPEFAETKLLYAEALMKAGQSVASRRFLDSALALGADPSVVAIMRAQAYARDYSFDSATTAYNEGRSHGELSYRAWVEAAEYFETVGSIDSALVASEKAYKLGGERPASLWRYLELSLRHNCFTTARKIRAIMKKKEYPNQIQYAAEMWYEYARKDYTRAKKALNGYGQGIKNRLSIWLFEIIIRGAAGDELTIISNIGAISSEMIKKEYDPEFQRYMKFLTAVEATQYLGDVIGLDYMSDVADIFYNRQEYLTKMAQMYHGSGQEKKFREFFERSARYHGRQPNWLTALADIYAKFPDLSNDTAYYYYDKALEADSYYAPAFENKVKLALKNREYEKIEEFFTGNTGVVKIKPELIFLRAISLFEWGKNKEAFTYLKDAQSKVPEFYNWVIPIHNSLIVREEFEMMNSIANWLAESYPEYADAQLSAGELLLTAGKPAGAVIDRAIELEPERLDGMAMKARALYSEGKAKQAIAILEDNLTKDRTHLMSNRYLGIFMAENGIEPNKSQNYSRYAVGLSSHDLSTWMDLCYVYTLVGRYDLAKGEGRKAMTAFPYRPEPFYWTGLSEYQLGDSKASEHLKKSIANGLRGEHLKEAKDILAKIK